MSLSTQIILVRHGKPLIDPARPAADWPLDTDAAGDVTRLAGSLAPSGVDAVVTSAERKAIGTGEIIAHALGVPARVDARLGEQGDGTVPWIAEPAAFRAAVQRHFRMSGDRVLGEESSGEAAIRFAGAVEAVRATYRLPVLVTHGRVLSAYVARVTGQDAWAFWNDLRMPDAFLLDLQRRAWRSIEEDSGA